MRINVATFSTARLNRHSHFITAVMNHGLWLLVLAASTLPTSGVASCTLRPGETIAELILPLRQEIGHDNRHYFLELLQLALNKTQTDYGPCQATLAKEPKPQARLYEDLAHNEGVHIIDATAGKERNERFLPIPVPLLKGLMGYRIAFIRPEDKAAFARVKNLSDLRAFTAGQGMGWLDVEILRINGIGVTATKSYDSLFRMLRAGRFDFFPRGAQEVLREAESFDIAGLAIEQHLIIAYPWPVYFFVHKDHTLLAERIETGLQRAKDDGDFDRFFNKHPFSRDVFEQLNFSERRTIYLCNPQHNQPALLNQKDAWIKPWPEDLCTLPESF